MYAGWLAGCMDSSISPTNERTEQNGMERYALHKHQNQIKNRIMCGMHGISYAQRIVVGGHLICLCIYEETKCKVMAYRAVKWNVCVARSQNSVAAFFQTTNYY